METSWVAGDFKQMSYPSLCGMLLLLSSVLVSLFARFKRYAVQQKRCDPAAVKQQSTSRALPSIWYRSPEMYELERRAIFCRRWILVTHKLRFNETGDWVKFQEAGFPFMLCLNQDGTIKGFHNVCRHRAFPIVTGNQGNSKILSCKYHGWSYGLNGRLAKAPGYQDMEDFNRADNGLFPIHVHTDANGFVWINLDAAEKTEVSWSDDFDGVDRLPRHRRFNFEDYAFDHIWGMSGDYNWKTLADNYNECYHCSTSHPDVASLVSVDTYWVDNKGSNIQHFPFTSVDQEKAGMEIVSNFYYPNACSTVSPHFFYIMRCVPTSATHCSMEYEVYRHREASNEDFEQVDAVFKRILSEDKWLCNNAQQNLNTGVFVNGEMHPRMEKGPLYFQDRVRQHVRDHRDREEALGEEIWPVRQKLPKQSSRDFKFCTGLVCQQTSIQELIW